MAVINNIYHILTLFMKRNKKLKLFGETKVNIHKRNKVLILRRTQTDSLKIESSYDSLIKGLIKISNNI